MAQTQLAFRQEPKQGADGGHLRLSEQSGQLAISETDLLGWAAAKLGCDPESLEVIDREEQFDINFRAPDPDSNLKTTGHYRIRVTSQEASRLTDGKVSVMLHQQRWGASPAKGRHNVPAETAAALLGSRGWAIEATEPKKRTDARKKR